MESSLSPSCTILIDVSEVTLYSTPTDLTLSLRTPHSVCSRTSVKSLQLPAGKDSCSKNKTQDDDVKQRLSFSLPSEPGVHNITSCSPKAATPEFTCMEPSFVVKEVCKNDPDEHTEKVPGTELVTADIPGNALEMELQGSPADMAVKDTSLTSPKRSEKCVDPIIQGNLCNKTMDIRDCLLVSKEDNQELPKFVNGNLGQGDGCGEETQFLGSDLPCNRTVCLDQGPSDRSRRILDTGVNCTVIFGEQAATGLNRTVELGEGPPDLPDVPPAQQPVDVKQNGTFTADDFASGKSQEQSAPSKNGSTINPLRQSKNSQRLQPKAIAGKWMPLATDSSGKKEAPRIRPSLRPPATTQRRSIIRPQKPSFSQVPTLCEKQPAAAFTLQQPHCVTPKPSDGATKITVPRVTAPSTGASAAAGCLSLNRTVLTRSAVPKPTANQGQALSQGTGQVKTKIPSTSGTRLPRASRLPVRNRDLVVQPAAPNTDRVSTPLREYQAPKLGQAGLPTPIKKE